MRELGEVQADQVIARTQKCLVVQLDTAIALLAADLHRHYKLSIPRMSPNTAKRAPIMLP